MLADRTSPQPSSGRSSDAVEHELFCAKRTPAQRIGAVAGGLGDAAPGAVAHGVIRLARGWDIHARLACIWPGLLSILNPACNIGAVRVCRQGRLLHDS